MGFAVVSFLDKFLSLFFFFRESGALGFPWLGKAYFTVCLSLSWTASRYFQVFAEDSSHSWFVLLTVKLLGVLFLSQSSSNLELSLILVLVGLCVEKIYDWYSFFAIVLEASHAPKNYVANRTKVSLGISTDNEVAKTH